MAVDTPARIAMIGAGPIGLEAALYARFLGYDVDIYERSRVAAHVRQWGRLTMLTPFADIASPLGLAALQAQDPDYRPPDPQALLTGRQWAAHYLEPLAQTDLIADHLRLGQTVRAVRRLPPEADAEGDDARFELEVAADNGPFTTATADIVIDASGVYGNPNGLGPQGLPVTGEAELRDRICHDPPDMLGADRDRYAGRHTLLIGDGCSAAATFLAWRALAAAAAETRLTWVIRRQAEGRAGQGPICLKGTDPPLRQRRLAEQANRAVADRPPRASLCWNTTVASIAYDADGGHYAVQLQGGHAGVCWCDQIVANVGRRPDCRLWAPLGLDPLDSLAAAGPLADAAEPRSLVTSQPNFYVLGTKRCGGDSGFLMRHGWQQIRALFSLIGDRPDLDLYQGARRLLG